MNEVVGLKRAVVVDLNDKDKLNKVKLRLIYENHETEYADVLAKFPGTGDSSGEKSGSVFIPSVGEEVIVGFVDGNINCPVVLGSVYNSKNKPPINVNKKNEIMHIAFPAGMKINIDNKKDKQKVDITTKKGHLISLDDGKENLTIQSKKSDTLFKIDFKRGEIIIKAKKKISFVAGKDASLVIEDQKGMSFNSKSGNLVANMKETKIGAKTNITLDAKAKMVAKGAASSEFSSSGATTVKGGILKLN